MLQRTIPSLLRITSPFLMGALLFAAYEDGWLVISQPK